MVSGLQDGLAKEFPYFCRRVCFACNGSIRDILEHCPIIRLDAYLWLTSRHTNGDGKHPAQLLTEEVQATITAELVTAVANHSPNKGRTKYKI